jgi:hypothetical protein
MLMEACHWGSFLGSILEHLAFPAISVLQASLRPRAIEGSLLKVFALVFFKRCSGRCTVSFIGPRSVEAYQKQKNVEERFLHGLDV